MDTAKALETAETLLQPWTKGVSHPETHRLDVVIDVKDFKTAVKTLLDAHWGYLAAITGIDHAAPIVEPPTEQPEGYLEALYHFCEGGAVVTLRIRLPYAAAVIPTVCDLIPSATLYERELIEMFGIDTEGTPTRDHLILPDDWPDGVYPLRKSFTGFAPATQA